MFPLVFSQVISIIGRTLEPLDEDNLIPAYGFGDSITMGQSVFPFKEQAGVEVPCKGFTDVLDCYGVIANRITLGGPTNFAPVINKAVQIVRNSKRLVTLHLLVTALSLQLYDPGGINVKCLNLLFCGELKSELFAYT